MTFVIIWSFYFFLFCISVLISLYDWKIYTIFKCFDSPWELLTVGKENDLILCSEEVPEIQWEPN